MNRNNEHRRPVRLSRERIVDAAFRAWGRTQFTVTSLNLVAEELSVTKPAVYRYFNGKDELLEELCRDYARRVATELVARLEQADGVFRRSDGDTGTLELAASVYVDAVFTLFERNPYHYAFFVRYLLGRPVERHPELFDTVRRHDSLLLQLLPSRRALRYTGATAAFWTTEHYRRDPVTGRPISCTVFFPERLSLNDEARTRTIGMTVRRLVHGYLPPDSRSVDLEMVERIAWLTAEEMPVPDRIFTAIEDVVQEHGYAAATVERVAERVGITKSSIYHYFRNRDEMLMQVVLRDQQHFASLARIRLQQIEYPEQQLYALFVMIASYSVQHSIAMTLENWIRENDITVEIPQEHIGQMQSLFSFLTDMVMTGRLTADPGEAFSLIGFVRFLIMQELDLLEKPIERDACISVTRALFSLFSRGLSGSGALAEETVANKPRRSDLETIQGMER